MQKTYSVTVNEHPPQFEIHTDEDKAYLVYQYKDGDLVLMHTYVPNSLRSKGIAAELAKFALEYAKEKGLKVIVYCPFVSAYLKKHPEYNDLIKTNEPR